MRFKRTVEPATEPVTTAEAKTQARVTTSSDDAFIAGLIKAARDQVEAYTTMALITQTWRMTLDHFPCFGAPIDLPVNPIQSISSITYIDTAGELQTWPADQYTLDESDKSRSRITPAYNVSYPSTRDVMNTITLTFIAGYGTADAVPESFKLAMKMMITHWYDNRGDLGTLPPAAERLIKPYRSGF